MNKINLLIALNLVITISIVIAIDVFNIDSNMINNANVISSYSLAAFVTIKLLHISWYITVKLLDFFTFENFRNLYCKLVKKNSFSGSNINE